MGEWMLRRSTAQPSDVWDPSRREIVADEQLVDDEFDLLRV